MKHLTRLGAVSTSLLLALAAGGGLLAGGAMLATGTTPCELLAACDTGAKATTVSDTKATTGACPISGAAATHAQTVANKAECADAAKAGATTVANKTEKTDDCCALGSKAAAIAAANTTKTTECADAAKAQCPDAAKAAATTVANTAAKGDDCCAAQATTVAAKTGAECTDAVKATTVAAAKTDDCCAPEAMAVAAKSGAQCTDAVKATPAAATTAKADDCCAAQATTVAAKTETCTQTAPSRRMIMAAGRFPIAVPATFGVSQKTSCTDGVQAATVANAEYVCSGEPGCEDADAPACSKGEECHKATTAQAEQVPAAPAGAGF